MLNNADPSSFSGIYIVCGYTDLRFGIDTLSSIIETRYHLPIFVPNTLFLFCGKRANRIKGLVWEGDGFLLFTKRVDSGHFTWPRNSREARLILPHQFKWLMQGFAIEPCIRELDPRRSA